MKQKNPQPRILYRAKLAFRFDGEIKSIPDKQKWREFSTTKPAIRQMLKNFSRQETQHKGRKRPAEDKTKTIKKMVIGSCCCYSVTESCLTLFDPKDCSIPGLPIHHQPPELAEIHVHWVGDAVQPSHPLSSSSPSTLNLSQYLGLFQWVSF